MDAEGGRQPIGGGEGYDEGYDDEDETGYPHEMGDYADDDMLVDGVVVNGGVVGDVGEGDEEEEEEEDEDEGGEEEGDAIDEMNHGMNSFDILAAGDAVGLQEVGHDDVCRTPLLRSMML